MTGLHNSVAPSRTSTPHTERPAPSNTFLIAQAVGLNPLMMKGLFLRHERNQPDANISRILSASGDHRVSEEAIRSTLAVAEDTIRRKIMLLDGNPKLKQWALSTILGEGGNGSQEEQDGSEIEEVLVAPSAHQIPSNGSSSPSTARSKRSEVATFDPIAALQTSLRLNSTVARCLSLAYVERETPEQIAQVLNMRISQVRMWLDTGLKAIRGGLDGIMGENRELYDWVTREVLKNEENEEVEVAEIAPAIEDQPEPSRVTEESLEALERKDIVKVITGVVGLSKRERECLEAIFQGALSNQRIAERVGIKPAAVSVYLTYVRNKIRPNFAVFAESFPEVHQWLLANLFRGRARSPELEGEYTPPDIEEADANTKDLANEEASIEPSLPEVETHGVSIEPASDHFASICRIAGISPIQGQCFLLAHQEGLSADDIAARIGLSENTVKQRLRQASDRLDRAKDHLAQFEPEANQWLQNLLGRTQVVAEAGSVVLSNEESTIGSLGGVAREGTVPSSGITEPVAEEIEPLQSEPREEVPPAAETIDPAPESTDVSTFEVNGERYVYRSEKMHTAVLLAERLANEEMPVLILGETGVGKEGIARLLHERSKRSDEPFSAINCAAIPADLLESELFGYKKGAFTGATADRRGLFETVGAGTLFLDEIGEMEPRMQAKLLRVLQERRFSQVGSSTNGLEFRGRIVTATNRDIAQEIRTRIFRPDLFYRIAQSRIAIPKLTERPEDIDPLVDLFLTQLNPKLRIDDTARAKLQAHSFPGNVRELQAVLRQAYILATLHSTDHPVIGEEHIDFFPVA